LWTTTCPISGSSLLPAHCWPACFSSLCLLKFMWQSAPCSSPLLWCTFSFLPHLLCASFPFLGYFSAFCCCCWECQSAQGAMLVYPRGGWEEFHVTLCTHLFGLPNVSQAGLEMAAGSSSSPPVFSV
jgi:hypothetical protein